MPVQSISLIVLMCGAGDVAKLVHFCTCVLTREMLVYLVNLEKCHSPLHLWLSPTGTILAIVVDICFKVFNYKM
jgi:hypothetical protein